MESRLKILVAEDDLGDVMLLKRAFAEAKVEAPVHFARDGQEVLDPLNPDTDTDSGRKVSVLTVK